MSDSETSMERWARLSKEQWDEPCPYLEDVIEEGPVLFFDIDGVCAPISSLRNIYGNYEIRFDRYRTPLDWGGMDQDNWHPLLPSWMTELEDAYRHVVWFSSASSPGCHHYAKVIGHDPARKWPYSSYKLRGILNWVAEDVPVACIDDQICSWNEERMKRFLSRPAPFFAVSPDPAIGMGRALVDHLLEFAATPHAECFAIRDFQVIYADPVLRWDWGGQEDPTGWPTERGRLRKIRENEREYFSHPFSRSLSD